jgi:hypothetical protein
VSSFENEIGYRYVFTLQDEGTQPARAAQAQVQAAAERTTGAMRQQAAAAQQAGRAQVEAARGAAATVLQTAQANVAQAAEQKAALLELARAYNLVADTAKVGSEQQVQASRLATAAAAQLAREYGVVAAAAEESTAVQVAGWARVAAAARAASAAAVGAGRASKEAQIQSGAERGLIRGTKLGRVGGFLSGAALGGAIGGFEIKAAFDAARNEELMQAQLQNTLKQSNLSWAANRGQIEQNTARLSKHSGFLKAELFQSLSTLVRVTHDVTAAERDQAIAVDVSRARHIDLQQATKMVMLAQQGHVGLLRRLGINITQVTTAQDLLRDSHAHATSAVVAQAKAYDLQQSGIKAISALQKQYAGSTDAYSKTSAGALGRLRVSYDELQVHIGQALNPAINSAADALGRWLHTVQQSETAHHVLRATLMTIRDIYIGASGIVRGLLAANSALGGAPALIMGAVIAFRILNAVITANPFVALAVLSSLVVGLIITHWKGISGFFSGLWRTISGAFTRAWNVIEETALSVLKNIIEPFSHLPGSMGQWARDMKVQLNAQLDQMATDASTKGKNIGNALGQGIVDAWKGYRGKLNPNDLLKGGFTTDLLSGGSMSTKVAGKNFGYNATTPAAGIGGGYVSPIKPGAAFERLDQGVDWKGSPGDFVVAIGKAHIDAIHDDPGGFGKVIYYTLLDGAAAGRQIYVGHALPVVTAGKTVQAGAHLAKLLPSGLGNAKGIRGHTEVGWASGNLPAAGLSEGTGSAKDFLNFVQTGVASSNDSTGGLPADVTSAAAAGRAATARKAAAKAARTAATLANKHIRALLKDAADTVRVATSGFRGHEASNVASAAEQGAYTKAEGLLGQAVTYAQQHKLPAAVVTDLQARVKELKNAAATALHAHVVAVQKAYLAHLQGMQRQSGTLSTVTAHEQAVETVLQRSERATGIDPSSPEGLTAAAAVQRSYRTQLRTLQSQLEKQLAYADKHHLTKAAAAIKTELAKVADTIAEATAQIAEDTRAAAQAAAQAAVDHAAAQVAHTTSGLDALRLQQQATGGHYDTGGQWVPGDQTPAALAAQAAFITNNKVPALQGQLGALRKQLQDATNSAAYVSVPIDSAAARSAANALQGAGGRLARDDLFGDTSSGGNNAVSEQISTTSQAAIDGILASIDDVTNQILQAQNEASDLMRQAAEAAKKAAEDAAQVVVNMAQHGETMASLGLETLKLQQQLQGPQYLNGSLVQGDQTPGSLQAQAQYIASTLIPAMRSDLAALQAQQQVALDNNDQTLAYQIAEAIAQKQNDLLQAQVTAAQDTAASTQQMADALKQYGGTTAFDYSGQLFTDNLVGV